MKAWSYSSLTAFETCPRRYYLTRVSKEVTEPQTEATIWGNRVHKALEDRINTGVNMPEGMEEWGKLADRMRAPKKQGMPFAEKKLCVNKYFHPTGWMAKDAWCRGIVDAGILRTGRITAVDWKTGKRKPESEQLKLSAAMLFAHYPHVETVTTAFVWLKDKKLDAEKFKRGDVSDIWNTFLPRVQRLEAAYASANWPPNPSGLCRNWCPVGKQLCQFCGG